MVTLSKGKMDNGHGRANSKSWDSLKLKCVPNIFFSPLRCRVTVFIVPDIDQAPVALLLMRLAHLKIVLLAETPPYCPVLQPPHWRQR